MKNTNRPIVLTQHGRSAAVLLGVAEYERLVERAELLEDVRIAEEQIARGEGVEHDEARQRVLAGKRLRELPALLASLPRLSDAEAAAFGEDLDHARASISPSGGYGPPRD